MSASAAGGRAGRAGRSAASTASAGELAERLRAVVDPLPTGAAPAVDAATGLPRSAVLLLADPGRPGLPLLFIRRSRLVRTHRGQIAFPGGGVEPGDAGVAATALREAREEVGVDPGSVEVVGGLSPLLTATNDRRLDPVVGLARGPVAPRADTFEVAEWFWVELTALLAAPLTSRPVVVGGTERMIHFLDLGERVIWGATATVVVDLLDRLRGGTPAVPPAQR